MITVKYNTTPSRKYTHTMRLCTRVRCSTPLKLRPKNVDRNGRAPIAHCGCGEFGTEGHGRVGGGGGATAASVPSKARVKVMKNSVNGRRKCWLAAVGWPNGRTFIEARRRPGKREKYVYRGDKAPSRGESRPPPQSNEYHICRSFRCSQRARAAV